MAFAQHIRSIRIGAGLSQRELAQRAGTTQAIVSRIESGKQSPTIAMGERLHAAVGRRMVVSSLPASVDPLHLAAERRLDMSARLDRAFAWMRFNAAMHGAARRTDPHG